MQVVCFISALEYCIQEKNGKGKAKENWGICLTRGIRKSSCHKTLSPLTLIFKDGAFWSESAAAAAAPGSWICVFNQREEKWALSELQTLWPGGKYPRDSFCTCLVRQQCICCVFPVACFCRQHQKGRQCLGKDPSFFSQLLCPHL